MGSLEIPEILCTVKMGLIKVSGEMLTVLWGRFSKVPKTNGPGKLLSFTFNMAVSNVLQML